MSRLADFGYKPPSVWLSPLKKENLREFFLLLFLKKAPELFYKQPSYEGSNVKNGLKVKQFAEQPPTLKTLMQNFGWILSKKFYFFSFKFIKAKFLHNFFWVNLIVFNSI